MGKRVVLIVLDSVGAGFLPDAEAFGDLGANTLGHIADALGLNLPHLEKLGLGNILPLRGVPPTAAPRGAWGRAASQARGKDTTVGHWEIAGHITTQPLPTWPQGIPQEVRRAFEEKIGRGTLGGTVASGTEILVEFGAQHVASGQPIVYTSADSVFQIAAHEEVVPLDTLYQWCKIAREMLNVGRVIARPFVGTQGDWQRTPHRHDYSLEVPGETVLDRVKAAGLPVIGVGKISDIFAGRGLTDSHPITSNHHGMDVTLDLVKKPGKGLIFVNLVDFDSKFGHRRDVRGYRDALEAFDQRLGELLPILGPEDILMITADHGNDPIFKGTDHTREYVPLLVTGKTVKPVDLGTRSTFADMAATIDEILLGQKTSGSFAPTILR